MTGLLDGATIPWDHVARHHHKAELHAYRKTPDPVPVTQEQAQPPTPRGVASFAGRAIDLATRFGRRAQT